MLIGFGFNSLAQEAQNFKEKTIHLIRLTGGQQFQVMVEPLIKMVPQENQDAFKKELEASVEDLYAKLAVVYMDSYTEKEVDEILAFYATPIGKKMIAETPKLTKKGMEIGQAWGMKLQPIMAKYQ